MSRHKLAQNEILAYWTQVYTAYHFLELVYETVCNRIHFKQREAILFSLSIWHVQNHVLLVLAHLPYCKWLSALHYGIQRLQCFTF